MTLLRLLRFGGPGNAITFYNTCTHKITGYSPIIFVDVRHSQGYGAGHHLAQHPAVIEGAQEADGYFWPFVGQVFLRLRNAAGLKEVVASPQGEDSTQDEGLKMKPARRLFLRE